MLRAGHTAKQAAQAFGLNTDDLLLALRRQGVTARSLRREGNWERAQSLAAEVRRTSSLEQGAASLGLDASGALKLLKRFAFDAEPNGRKARLPKNVVEAAVSARLNGDRVVDVAREHRVNEHALMVAVWSRLGRRPSRIGNLMAGIERRVSAGEKLADVCRDLGLDHKAYKAASRALCRRRAEVVAPL